MIEGIIGIFLLLIWLSFVYGYVMRTNKHEEKCNIVYYPDNSHKIKNINETMAKELDQPKFDHTRNERAPLGISSVDLMIPRVNIRYDSTELSTEYF